MSEKNDHSWTPSIHPLHATIRPWTGSILLMLASIFLPNRNQDVVQQVELEQRQDVFRQLTLRETRTLIQTGCSCGVWGWGPLHRNFPHLLNNIYWHKRSNSTFKWKVDSSQLSPLESGPHQIQPVLPLLWLLLCTFSFIRYWAHSL